MHHDRHSCVYKCVRVCVLYICICVYTHIRVYLLPVFKEVTQGQRHQVLLHQNKRSISSESFRFNVTRGAFAKVCHI